MTSESSNAPLLDPEVLELVKLDLAEARQFLQRQVTAERALLGTAITLFAGLVGFAVANDGAGPALLAVPIVLIVGYVAGTAAVHRRRAARRVFELERLLHAFAVATRERGVARPRACERLQRQLDQYEFGVEATLEKVDLADVVAVNMKRMGWWLYAVLATTAGVIGATTDDGTSSAPVCVADGEDGTVELSVLPEVVSGSLTVVPCPPAAVNETIEESSGDQDTRAED